MDPETKSYLEGLIRSLQMDVARRFFLIEDRLDKMEERLRRIEGAAWSQGHAPSTAGVEAQVLKNVQDASSRILHNFPFKKQ
ncbi:MAG TPA: hypothetical protein VKU19_08445 [Bryobacteraceae bacterium]|nr:hypothetical protein [Bryobacteraceae bacterium]